MRATRENVRRALAKVLEPLHRQDKKEISVTKLRGAGSGDQNATTTLLRLWRAGELSIAEPWTDAPASPGEGQGAADLRAELAARLRVAGTDADREAALLELAALVAAGSVDPDEANAIRGATQEARQAAEAKRSLEPPAAEAERFELVGEAEAQAALALFYMVSKERRARLLAMIEAELAADMAEHPNVDAMGGQR